MPIRIRVNEREVEVASGSTLDEIRESFKSDADVLVLNGFPGKGHETIDDGDEVVLIRRGEVPEPDELETLLVSRHTPGVHRRIKEARVGVAGLGGLGSQVAIAMARMGVGQLVLVDYDVVEPSNLNRQQYFIDQIGERKVAALSETLQRINPCVELHTHDVELTPKNIPEVFAGCDILVEAFDRADQKEMLISTALDRLPDTRIIAASGLAGFEPSETVGIHRLSPRLFVVGDLETEAQPGVGLMAPRVGVAAHAQANLGLRLLLGVEE
jgi:sulfur carrier protein ThiS adenylyltransferase